MQEGCIKMFESLKAFKKHLYSIHPDKHAECVRNKYAHIDKYRINPNNSSVDAKSMVDNRRPSQPGQATLIFTTEPVRRNTSSKEKEDDENKKMIGTMYRFVANNI